MIENPKNYLNSVLVKWIGGLILLLIPILLVCAIGWCQSVRTDINQLKQDVAIIKTILGGNQVITAER